jgi:hypothetical protein
MIRLALEDWCLECSFAREEPIVRFILDDTAVRARITEEIAGQTWAWGRLFHSPG